jgi:hypothetical protein
VSGRDETVVRLRLTAPAIASGHALAQKSAQPDRIVVDLLGTTLGSGARGVVGGRGPLLRVIPDQLDATTVQVTLEVVAPVHFRLENEGRVVTVTIVDEGLASPPTVPQIHQPAVPRPPPP